MKKLKDKINEAVGRTKPAPKDEPKPADKSQYHWENGVKVYHSYEDYCRD